MDIERLFLENQAWQEYDRLFSVAEKLGKICNGKIVFNPEQDGSVFYKGTRFYYGLVSGPDYNPFYHLTADVYTKRKIFKWEWDSKYKKRILTVEDIVKAIKLNEAFLETT